MTGFRVAFGGAQQTYDITPDLTCLGKVIGGGLPAAAYGGARWIMEQVAPVGPVYQAGTLSGNPLAIAAGNATLTALARPGVYDRLARAASSVASAFADAAERCGIAITTATAGSMWGFFLTDERVTDFTTAKRADTALYARLFHALLERGVYVAPSQFEAAFVSTAHDDATLDETRSAVRAAFEALR